MTKKVLPFPKYAKWLKDYCKNSSDPIIKDSWDMLEYCFQLDQKVPNEYGWRFSSIDSIKLQVSKAKDPKEANRIYWLDQARNIEAYSVITFWRGIELIKPTIRSLNVHEIITPAVLVRSLLELCCVYIIHSNNLQKTFSEISFPDGTVVVSQEVENLIVKMIWGTRYGDPDDHVKQTNVLGFIKKVSKNPNASTVQDTYDFLCDIAHPSFIGNTRFWSHVKKINSDKSESRVIKRQSSGQMSTKIIDQIVWTLGWCAAVLRNSFEINASSINQLLNKLN